MSASPLVIPCDVTICIACNFSFTSFNLDKTLSKTFCTFTPMLFSTETPVYHLIQLPHLPHFHHCSSPSFVPSVSLSSSTSDSLDTDSPLSRSSVASLDSSLTSSFEFVSVAIVSLDSPLV